MIPFMFATGIENSIPTIDHGRIRRDQMRETGHDRRWREDFALVADLGVRWLRYSIPLHRSWLGPDRYDWEFADLALNELRHPCILGTDYYPTNEHYVLADGAMESAHDLLGYAAIAFGYWERYRLPLMHTETNLDQGARGDEAVEWLRRQWALVRSLAQRHVPMLGFTWYGLLDQVDWDIQLREQRGKVNPRGLFDLERRERPVARAWRELTGAWSGHV